MLQKTLVFIHNNWQDIISITISIIAIVVSVIAKHRTSVIEKQNKEEPLYADIQKLIKYKCDYFSSEMKIIGAYSPCDTVSSDEMEVIKRKVKRVFGRKKYNDLCDILSLCVKAQNINADLSTLFNLINELEPEDYIKLSNNLQIFESDIPDSAKSDAKSFLATISIPYYQFTDEEPGKSYDFFELYNQISLLDAQINKKKKEFDKSLKKAMMKR